MKGQADSDGRIGFAPQDRRGRLARQDPLIGVNDAQAVHRNARVLGELRLEHIRVSHEDDVEVRFRTFQSADGAGHLDHRGCISAHGVQSDPHVDRSVQVGI